MYDKITYIRFLLFTFKSTH